MTHTWSLHSLSSASLCSSMTNKIYFWGTLDLVSIFSSSLLLLLLFVLQVTSNDTSFSFFNFVLKHTPQVLMMKPPIICDRLSNNNLMSLCSKKGPNKVPQSNRSRRTIRVCRVKANPKVHTISTPQKAIRHNRQDFSVCSRHSLKLYPRELV